MNFGSTLSITGLCPSIVFAERIPVTVQKQVRPSVSPAWTAPAPSEAAGQTVKWWRGSMIEEVGPVVNPRPHLVHAPQQPA